MDAVLVDDGQRQIMVKGCGRDWLPHEPIMSR